MLSTIAGEGSQPRSGIKNCSTTHTLKSAQQYRIDKAEKSTTEDEKSEIGDRFFREARAPLVCTRVGVYCHNMTLLVVMSANGGKTVAKKRRGAKMRARKSTKGQNPGNAPSSELVYFGSDWTAEAIKLA